MVREQISIKNILKVLLVAVLVLGLLPLQGFSQISQAHAEEISEGTAPESGGGSEDSGEVATTPEPDAPEAAASDRTMTTLAQKTAVWAESLWVADVTKYFGSPDPQFIVMGLPSGLVQGVDYTVTFNRYEAGETVNKVNGYHLKAVTFTFLNTNYRLQGDENAIKEGRLFIAERPITITANSATKVYDATPLTNSGYTVGGAGLPTTFAATATVAISGSQTNVGSSANTVGTVSIWNGSTDVTGSCIITKVNGTLSVTKRPLTVRAEDKVVDFGNPPPAYTIAYTGFVGGQTAANLATAPTATSTYVAGNVVGNYPITASGGVDSNYSFIYQTGTLTVRPNTAAITVTAKSKTKTYDGTALTEPGFTVTNLPAGFTVETTVTGSIITVAQSATGNNVVGNVLIRRTSDNADVTASFSNIVKVNGSLTVTRAPLTASVTNMTITYGDPAPTYAVTYSGFVNSETISVLTSPTTLSGTYVQGNNAGTYPITGSGATAANYTVNYLQGALTVSRNSTVVTVTAASQSKVYDGTPLTNPNYTVSLIGILPAGHTVTATIGGSATTVAQSGSANNMVNIVSIRNAANQDVTANFANIVKVDGGLVITRAPLTANVASMTINYGDAVPTYSASYSGFVNSETSSVIITPSTFSCTYAIGSPVNTYPITGTGATAANYTVNYQPGTLTVAKNTTLITVTAASQSKVYDGAALTNSNYTVATSSALPSGHTVETTVTGSATTVAQSGSANNVVGTVIIKNSGGTDVTSNFTNIVKVPGGLVITPAPLTANVDDKSIIFGASAPTYSVTYSGFVNSETSSVLTTATTFSGTYTQGDPVGTYPITGSGATAANYSVSYLQGTLMVNPDGSYVTVTARSASKVYDGTPITEAGYDVVGLPSGYTLTATVASSTPITNVDDNGVSVNHVTDYTITRNSDSADVTDNFSNVVLVAGQLSITAAPLTIEMTDYVVSYSSPIPSYGVTYTGFISGENEYNALENLVVPSCNYLPSTPAGTTLPITQGTGTIPNHGNYAITYLQGTIVVTLYPDQITVQASYASKMYDGTPLTSPACITSGLPPNHSITVVATGSATTVADGSTSNNNPVGTIVIRDPGGDDVTSSFPIVTVPGTLTITPAPLLANINDMSVVFGDVPPTYGVTYSGFVNGEDESVITTPTTLTGNYVAGNDAGSYDITGSGASADNYTITYLKGILTVQKNSAPIVITGAYDTKAYDGIPLTNDNFTVTGLPVGYTADALVTGSATVVADSGNNVVSGAQIFSGLADVTENFSNITLVDGTLTITPAPLLAHVNDMSVVYGDDPPIYTVTYSGFVGSDDEGVVTTPIDLVGTYSAGDNAGAYPINGSGATADNYVISYMQGILTVQKNSAPIIIAGASDTKVYDGTPLTNSNFTVTGLPGAYTADATVTGSVTDVADSPAGNVVSNAQILSGLTDVTANFSNITLVNGTLAITKAPLLANVDDKSITFGDPAPTYTVTYSGFVNDEDESVVTGNTLTGTYLQGQNAGNYDINGSGATADNYEISYIKGNLMVVRNSAPIVITAPSESKVYDGTPLTATTVTATGLPAGYGFSSSATGSITNVADSIASNNPVGSVTILYGATDVTLNFSNVTVVPGTLTITPAPLTVEATDFTITYLDPVPVYPLTYTGFFGSDDPGDVTVTTPAGSSYTAVSPAGNYDIEGYAATADNYTVNFLPGTLAVQQNSTSIILTAASAVKLYDGTPLTASTYTSIPASLSLALPVGHTMNVVVTGSATNVDDTVAGNNQITSFTVRNASNVDVTSSFSNITTAPGNLTITPVPLSATMDSFAVEVGTLSPTYTVTYSGWVNGEGESVLSSPTVGSSAYTPAAQTGASFVITGSGAVALHGNYTLVYQPGMLFVQDTEDVIVLAAPSASKVYDGLPLTADAIVSNGLPVGFTVEGVVVGSVTDVPDSGTFNNDIVSYVIRNPQGDDVTNSFTNRQTVDGSLTITPREVVIDANDLTKVKGAADPAFTATVLNEAPFGDALIYSLARVPGEDVGTYVISVASFVDNPDYVVTTDPGLLTITAPPATKPLSATGDTFVPLGVTAGVALAVSVMALALFFVRRRRLRG